jgi:hypothetical protein
LYHQVDIPDINKILRLDFELDYSIIKGENRLQRICPIIEIAKEEDAKIISDIFTEVYHGTYPYKKMHSIKGIIDMINSPTDYWFIFKLDSNQVIGAFGSHLEFEEKRGLLYGFVIRKGFHKTVDIFKAFMVCSTYLWKKYQEEILVWYGEIRTNETAAQYTTSFFGLKPIGFLPNKDIFFNQVESDILHVIYNQDVLSEYRKKMQPKIIRQVLNCYSYTNKRFKLGLPLIRNPKIEIDKSKLEQVKENISLDIEDEKFGNKRVIFSNRDNLSFFKFTYNPYSKNFEKTDYEVNCLEELNAFLDKLIKLIEDWNINYCECYVSAYNAEHQKLFYNQGFKARGYVPSWKFIKYDNLFEDRVLFNYFTGTLDENMKVIPEAKELIQTVNNSEESLIQNI